MFYSDEFRPHDGQPGPGPEGRHGPGRRGHHGGPDDERGRHGRGGPRPDGGGPRGGRRGGGRGRAGRGDVRIATLLLLSESPMHGYQLMQAMADRTDGAWRPSPGAVYPTIAQLEDDGLVTTAVDGGRKLVTLTEAGRGHVEEQRAGWGDPFGQVEGAAPGPDLRGPLHELHAAARQVAVSGTPAQVQAATAVLAEARRSLYLILAGEAEGDRG
ncbi:Transcriptional regulator PadR-like family protein [Friedmanniella luteola]|uniref:Transcriptional regulator PadR-like family protein n=1 Tax=Friedmanniella luteola TaxID=546871 RepID=A0A1H1SH54_9ACTN|nr:Transcriptional regulator PadR-like family protein [Friedmanniella luteola]